MPFLVALSVLTGLLCLLNLALTVGLVKRVRDHGERLSAMTHPEPVPMLDIGERVAEFAVVTMDGEHLTRDRLKGGTLVGFFDSQCEVCHDHMPGFIEAAAKLPGGREQALAVIREGEDVAEMATPLARVARVVLERKRGPVARAFRLRATPAFCRLGEDQVVRVHEYEFSAAS